MLTPLLVYALLVLSLLVALLAIVLVNLAVLPTLGQDRAATSRTLSGDTRPWVAVLVPARNEEENIAACVRSLLSQDYPNLEIWIYDDASTDSTPEILAAIRTAKSPFRVPYSRFHVVEGKQSPPPGWLGKAHACFRLYEAMLEQSEPDYVLFTDADVRFGAHAVSRAVAAVQRYDAGLLSLFPRQVTLSWAERLAVPLLLHWAVYSFLPLPLAFSRRTGPAFAAANGQFILFKREAYEACGGHERVRSQVLEDVALAREVKRAGYLALLADGGPLVYTRMYNGAGDVWGGYSKNAYAFFGYTPLFLAIGIVALLALYVLPVGLAVAYWSSPLGLLFLAQYVVAVLARLALAWRFKYRLLDTLFHPIAVLYLAAIEINSFVWAITGRGEWKGRSLSR